MKSWGGGGTLSGCSSTPAQLVQAYGFLGASGPTSAAMHPCSPAAAPVFTPIAEFADPVVDAWELISLPH